VTLTLVAVVFVIILGLQAWQKTRTPPGQSDLREIKSEDPKLEAGVVAIASQFTCSCGSCGEKRLDTCDCKRAIEERGLIRDSLQAGKTSNQVIQILAQAYGGKKEESRIVN
jgi:cytochrome c-type biogenesis protein CcmH/NrfF